jgi:hypothetical protein
LGRHEPPKAKPGDKQAGEILSFLSSQNMIITSRTLSKELRIIAKAEIHPGLFSGIFFEDGNDDLMYFARKIVLRITIV